MSIKSECLDHFCVFGEGHLRHLLAEYERHFNEERPHQGKGNRLISAKPAVPADLSSVRDVQCSARLGGLLKRYHHRAA